LNSKYFSNLILWGNLVQDSKIEGS